MTPFDMCLFEFNWTVLRRAIRERERANRAEKKKKKKGVEYSNAGCSNFKYHEDAALGGDFGRCIPTFRCQEYPVQLEE